MENKIKTVRNLIKESNVNIYKKTSEKSFKVDRGFDFKVVDSINDSKIDIEFKDFNEFKKVVKSATNINNIYSKLEPIKGQLIKKGVDYKSNFIIRIITSEF